MSEPRVLVVVADLHAGSTLAPFPPDMALVDGLGPSFGPIQKWLWWAWTDFTSRWIPEILAGDSYNIALNGDVREGIHHGTDQVYSAQVGFQTLAAKQMLAPLFYGARRRYVVRGTETHVGTCSESDIGHSLGAELHEPTGYYAAHNWKFHMNGVLISLRHHIEPCKRKYLEASQLSIALGNEQLNCTRAGVDAPRVICRAHRHVHGIYSDGMAMTVVSPAWQLKTNHAEKVVPDSCEAIGAYALDFRSKKWGELPDVRTYLRTPSQQYQPETSPSPRSDPTVTIALSNSQRSSARKAEKPSRSRSCAALAGKKRSSKGLSRRSRKRGAS